MEYVKEIVSCVANTVASPILNPILKHVKYPFTAVDNTTALESAIANLRAQRDDVHTKITDAQQENGAATAQAQLWLDKVTAIEEEASHIQEEYRQLPRCLYNICPNVWSVYKTSKMAADKLVKANSLIEKIPESLVHMPPLPLAQEMPASSSISPNLQTTLDCVNDDVHSIIGICGMGGVGKTHLSKQINNELSRNHAFRVIVFVTCSKECSEETVQNKIFDWLYPSKNENGSKERKKSMIFEFLKERSFVLLLDDLWDRVDLEEIGIPKPTCTQKIVLTTRSTGVCGQMEVDKIIKVKNLDSDGAWSLFKEKVTEITINSNRLIEGYARNVVKELGGLPLAIIIVGRAMHDKRDPGEWEHALLQLRQANFNDVESVFYILKFSYDSLRDETLKKCFLHCSLWPEDFQIPKDELVEVWMGLGLIGNQEINQEIQATYNSGYSYIGRLKAACLLEVDDDGCYIKMHDLIRDMARWITKGKWIVQPAPNIIFHENKGQMESKISVSEGTETLSIMETRAEEFSFSTRCPSTKPTTLLLKHNRLNKSIAFPRELFSELTTLDLSHNHLEVLPEDICKLVHLQFLNLSYNSFKSLPKELGDLTELKYLLLRGLSCTFPVWTLSKLKALRMLDFSWYYPGRFEEIEFEEKYSELLKTLTKEQFPDFQALGIPIWDIQKFAEFCEKVSVPVRWLEVGGHKERCLSFSRSFFGNTQFNNLVSIVVRGTNDVQHVLFEKFGNHISCCLERLERLGFQTMKSLEKVIWKNLDPKDVFPRLQCLEFYYCRNLSSISWVLNLPCIRELLVIGCHNIKQLICIDELQNNGINVSQYSVSSLKLIVLQDILELESISDPIVTFPSLEILVVLNCGKLRKLPFNTGDPPRTLKRIRGLEEWWNNVEMGNGSHRSSLNAFFKPIII